MLLNYLPLTNMNAKILRYLCIIIIRRWLQIHKNIFCDRYKIMHLLKVILCMLYLLKVIQVLKRACCAISLTLNRETVLKALYKLTLLR